MGTVVRVAVLLTMVISVEADNSQCSKDWIRDLIVNACNFSKRDAKMMEYVIEEAIGTNRELFSTYMSYDVQAHASFNRRRWPPTMKPTTKQPSTLVGYDVSSLLQQMETDSSSWQRRARQYYENVRDLMEKCCRTLCNEKEFRVLCYVGTD